MSRSRPFGARGRSGAARFLASASTSLQPGLAPLRPLRLDGLQRRDALCEERRTTTALRTALRAVAEADDDLARAEASRREALDQARAAVADD